MTSKLSQCDVTGSPRMIQKGSGRVGGRECLSPVSERKSQTHLTSPRPPPPTLLPTPPRWQLSFGCSQKCAFRSPWLWALGFGTLRDPKVLGAEGHPSTPSLRTAGLCHTLCCPFLKYP